MIGAKNKKMTLRNEGRLLKLNSKNQKKKVKKMMMINPKDQVSIRKKKISRNGNTSLLSKLLMMLKNSSICIKS